MSLHTDHTYSCTTIKSHLLPCIVFYRINLTGTAVTQLIAVMVIQSTQTYNISCPNYAIHSLSLNGNSIILHPAGTSKESDILLQYQGFSDSNLQWSLWGISSTRLR